jgi:hypothetical protein
MADTDQNPEAMEPEKEEQETKPIAKKKVAKKKAAKKKVAKKKVAKKKAVKKTLAEKDVQIVETTETPKAPAVAEPEELHEQIQRKLGERAHAAPPLVIDKETENKQTILLWWSIIAVCILLILSLSPESDETVDSPQTPAAEKAPATITPPETSGPPSRPEGSPPGYWRHESGAWQFIPYETDEAQPAPEVEPEAPAKVEEAAAPVSEMAPPELPADSPPGYWNYTSQQGDTLGNWVYVPYEAAR